MNLDYSADLRASPTAEQLAAENETLRRDLATAARRAELAEDQLRRVHRAVGSIKKDMREARDRRNELFDAAKRHASELIRQAQAEAERISPGFSSVDSSTLVDSWTAHDPSLDQRLDNFLQNDLEPDASRDWILGDESG